MVAVLSVVVLHFGWVVFVELPVPLLRHLAPVQVLLLCAKHLFGAANVSENGRRRP
jgi:hypothetical protein